MPDILTLQAATKLFAGNPHVRTLDRWARKGIYGVRLKSWLEGKRRVTSLEDIQAFKLALRERTADKFGDDSIPTASAETLDTLASKILDQLNV